MKLNSSIQERITRFAREQSRYYLEEAEMSYIEQLRKKSHMTIERAKAKVDKYIGRSKKSIEAEEDLAIYMSDYINDLIANGMSPEEALETAEAELKFNNDNAMTEEIQTKYQEYYETVPIYLYEAIGLFYGAVCVIGIVLGGLVGIILGTTAFSGSPLWIPAVIGMGAGALSGAAVGMMFHVKTILNYNRHR